jgi:hypothetical protein
MELLALNASIVSPLDACSSRSARVAASSSWLPHELECFRSPQQQPGKRRKRRRRSAAEESEILSSTPVSWRTPAPAAKIEEQENDCLL